MRITTKMLTQSLINNVNTNLQNMEVYQNQISSDKKITKPSDDPIATGQLLSAKSASKAQEQYARNMEDASLWLDTVDGALGQANDVLQRARELAVSGSTGTMPEESMDALAAEVDGLIGEMVQVANTNYAGRYIFGGGKTTAAPYKIDENDENKVVFIGDVDDLDAIYSKKIEIEAGVTMDISAGRMTFHTDVNGDDEVNAVFKTLIDLRTALNAGENDTVNTLLDDFDKLIDNVLSERAVVGVKVNRMESALKRSATYEFNLSKLISELEDTDYAEASTGLSTQKAVYEASLAVGAKLIQPSLLDFLS